VTCYKRRGRRDAKGAEKNTKNFASLLFLREIPDDYLKNSVFLTLNLHLKRKVKSLRPAYV